MEDNLISQSHSLKLNSVNRILKDMIGETKKIAENNFIIIIVDDYTATILSSFLTMSEVINEGIFSIDRLGTKRQKFPKYHALYFISPTVESCELVVKDFEEESAPQYSRVHIFFSHRIMDLTLEKLVNQNLINRVKTCKELNLSFLIKGKNLFDLGMPSALKIFTVKNNIDARTRLLSTVMERLITVCTVMGEYPYIQYQKSSSLCFTLAETLNAQLSDFYQTKNYNEKRGILLITDRTIDVTTPFLHDYSYESLVYDILKVNDGELDFNDKKHRLDEKDELWTKYKNRHAFVVIFDDLPREVEEFAKSDLSKVSKTEQLENFDQMANALHNVKGFKSKSTQFSLHQKIAEELIQVFLFLLF